VDKGGDRRITLYLGNRSKDRHYNVNAINEEVFKGGDYDAGEQGESDFTANSDKWYRIMWVETGNSLDLYVDDALIYSAKGDKKQKTTVVDYECLMTRWSNRIDNIFIADNITPAEIANPNWPVTASVDFASKLATTWASIKTEL